MWKINNSGHMQIHFSVVSGRFVFPCFWHIHHCESESKWHKSALFYTASWSALSLNKRIITWQLDNNSRAQDDTCRSLTSQRPGIDINDVSVSMQCPPLYLNEPWNTLWQTWLVFQMNEFRSWLPTPFSCFCPVLHNSSKACKWKPLKSAPRGWGMMI